MEIIEHGIIREGAISFDHPLPLQEGSRVRVRVELDAPVADALPAAELSSTEFSALPFFGQWAERTDMPDSSNYVRQERSKWQQRAFRQD